jgi:hypothetical protein
MKTILLLAAFAAYVSARSANPAPKAVQGYVNAMINATGDASGLGCDDCDVSYIEMPRFTTHFT